MPNYQLSKIYQIVCLTTGEKYIGSTTQATLALRLGGHCRGYKQWKNGKVNLITSYLIIERGNYMIELLEAYPCNSRDELNAREGHYIRTIECVNKITLGRTPQEHYQSNKEVFLAKRKEYVKTHKEEIYEQNKIYVEDHKTELAAYHKAYYQANKAKWKTYNTKP